jgi:ABC-type multidrug transport system fused ATPase/permease subunit
MDNEDKVYAAAKLSGADDIIDQLPDGLHTYLEHPVQSYHSTHNMQSMSHITDHMPISLSGGQMQKLAL